MTQITDNNADPEVYTKLVMDYLAAMEQRDLAKASEFQSGEFSMTFPGDVRFTSSGQLVEWARGRYLTVSKSIEGVDVCPGSDSVTVYCFGTLSGEWLDSTRFSGVRFIDRFRIVNGLITGQWVWNDLAETQLNRQ